MIWPGPLELGCQLYAPVFFYYRFATEFEKSVCISDTYSASIYVRNGLIEHLLPDAGNKVRPFSGAGENGIATSSNAHFH